MSHPLPLVFSIALTVSGRVTYVAFDSLGSAFALTALSAGYLLASPAATTTSGDEACRATASLPSIDTDRSDSASRIEWDAWTGATFDSLDLDHNGRVDQVEMNRALKVDSGEGKCGEGKCGEGSCGVRHIDTDGDGDMTRTEYITVHQRIFEAIDANHDGAITIVEECSNGD